MAIALREKAEEYYTLLRELERRTTEGISAYVPDDQPNHDQLRFHKSQKIIRLLTGGNKSGKTVAAAADCCWLATGTHPYRRLSRPANIWVVSAAYSTIYEGMLRHLDHRRENGMKFIGSHLEVKRGPKITGAQDDIPSFIDVRWQNSNGEFAGESRIKFISATGGETARSKTQSASPDAIYIDEEVDELVYKELLARLLDSGGFMVISASLLKSEDFILELETRGETGDPEVELVRLITDHNPHIDQVQVRRIFSQLSKEEQEVRRYGKSKRGAGLIYKNINDSHWLPTPEFKQHKKLKNGTIIPYFHPDEFFPKGTKYYTVVDDGFRTSAGLWLAHLPDQTVVAYREMYIHQAEIREDVVPFLQACPEIHESKQLIDPHAFATLTTGEMGVGDILCEGYGFEFVPGLNSVASGIQTVRYALGDHPKLGIPIFRAWDYLTSFRKELGNYRIKQDKSKAAGDAHPDRPRKKEDHLMDCWRMGIVEILGTRYEELTKEDFEEVDILPDGPIDNFLKNRKSTGKEVIHPVLGSEW
jgi:hypothetical protein